MSPREILLSSISFLVLLSSSIYIFHDLSKPIANYSDITWVYGLETLKREDIVCKLYKEKLDGKPILLANPVRISNRLKRHPLILKRLNSGRNMAASYWIKMLEASLI
jgi:hypothetical protein